MRVPHLKIKLIYDQAILLLCIYLKELKAGGLEDPVHSGIIRNSQKVGTTQMSTDE